MTHLFLADKDVPIYPRTHMDAIQRQLDIACQIDSEQKAFLLDNIDACIDAIYTKSVQTWWNDFLPRYIVQFPDMVLDEQSSGSRLHRWSIESLQQRLSQWTDTHGCSEAKVGYAYDKRANVTLRTIREVAGAFSDELSVRPVLRFIHFSLFYSA
ncbi:uncharacterized protein EV420DRAFT_1639536 [Desarmillaria tabescens]|uniref:Uncharacterized protein n=1 Tax=Armillaria tabescens TaxID=1929756 RepID=A0AA39T3R7_ARMTA|nr:uncharacterized protein EV420DRAFT_1639536 [Desarmillaria tabescens]KAK0462326.1 hypothetical protein EV420DRAFT_1639536 [Desarmillaria tabescens]